jgi:prepilin-type N-terminal cleavage/methylation domain-containing protein
MQDNLVSNCILNGGIMDRHHTKTAFTLIEMLLSLAIMAVVLTAVAVAFNGSAVNLSENKEIYQSTTVARMALTRVSNQLRTASKIATTTAGSILDFNDVHNMRQYLHYNSDAKTLCVDTAGHTNVLLCENVKSVRFTPTLGLDSYNHNVVQNVKIQMTISAGNSDANMATSVTIRKSLAN